MPIEDYSDKPSREAEMMRAERKARENKLNALGRVNRDALMNSESVYSEDDVPRRSSNIPGQVEELRDQLSKLMFLTRELEDRLDPVLLPIPVNAMDASDQDTVMSTSLIGDALSSLNMDIKEIQRRVGNLATRVHL